MEYSTERKLIDLYLDNIELLESSVGAVVNSKRSGAIESFNLTSLPDKRDERYKYTHLSQEYKSEYEKYFTCGNISCSETDLDMETEYVFDLCNGFSDGSMKTFENGIIMGSFAECSKKYPELYSRYNSLAEKGDAHVALNTAFAQDGMFLYVPKNVVESKFIVLNDSYDSLDEDLLCFSRSIVIVESGADIKLLINSRSMSENNFIINRTTEIFASDNAHLEIVEIDKFTDKTSHINNTFVNQSAYSSVKFTGALIDGKIIRNNRYVILEGNNSENDMQGIVVASSDQVLDNHMYVHHVGLSCNSFQKFKYIASDNSTGVFLGHVKVEKGAQQSVAMQQNNNILMSDTARIYTKPQLEIYADEVKCNHGATIGQLDESAIFYMRQRGISLQEAKRLQMHGFVNDIAGKISDERLAEYIDNLLLNKINSL